MVRLTILHTNDIHGRVEQLLRIATLVRSIRAQVEAGGGYCLYVDAGDAEDTSQLESSLTKGSAMEAMLRGAGCDQVALGNAIPLRYGPQAVAPLAAHFGRPLLCGNLFGQDGNLLEGLTPYARQDFGPLKASLIGLTDPIDTYRAVFHLDARDPIQVLPGLLERARADGAVFHILVSHLSSRADQRLAEAVRGLAVILGGHDHRQLYPPLMVQGTLLAQAGEFGAFLGRLDLEIDPETGKLLGHHAELLPVEESLPPDPQAGKVVESERRRVRKLMNRRVGVLRTELPLAVHDECGAGNLLADALLERVPGAQVSLALAGHWTSGLKAGPLTRGALFAANRSTANPARVRLRGEQIAAFLRAALKPENAARRLHALRDGAVGMPHVAGMKIVVEGDELAIVINGAPLAAHRTYVVAASDFEFSEIVGYLVIPDEQVEYELPTIMPEVLEDYIRARSPLAEPRGGRTTFASD